jgi:hypothetical protein
MRLNIFFSYCRYKSSNDSGTVAAGLTFGFIVSAIHDYPKTIDEIHPVWAVLILTGFTSVNKVVILRREKSEREKLRI